MQVKSLKSNNNHVVVLEIWLLGMFCWLKQGRTESQKSVTSVELETLQTANTNGVIYIGNSR